MVSRPGYSTAHSPTRVQTHMPASHQIISDGHSRPSPTGSAHPVRDDELYHASEFDATANARALPSRHHTRRMQQPRSRRPRTKDSPSARGHRKFGSLTQIDPPPTRGLKPRYAPKLELLFTPPSHAVPARPHAIWSAISSTDLRRVYRCVPSKLYHHPHPGAREVCAFVDALTYNHGLQLGQGNTLDPSATT